MATRATYPIGGNVVDTRTFARWMRVRRIEAKMSQEALGIAVGASRKHINRIENGHEIPSIELAKEIARVLDPGMRPTDLLELLVKPEPEDPQTKDEAKLLRAFRSRDIDTCIRIIGHYAA